MPFIRRLLSNDAALLADHLKRLDPEMRRLRFGATLDDGAVDSYVAGIDWMRSMQFAHIEDGEVRGACQLVWDLPLWPSSAELAVSVELPRQNQGIGSELIHRTLVAARNRSILHVDMQCLAENAKMRHIARKYESMLQLADGEVVGRVDLNHPDHLSLWEELFAEGKSVFDAFTQGWVRHAPH